MMDQIQPKTHHFNSLISTHDNSKQRKGGGCEHGSRCGGASSLACLYHTRLCMYALFPRACQRTDPAWANHDIIRSVACYRGLPSLKNVLLGSYDWANLLWLRQICLMVRQTREKRGDKKRVDNTPPILSVCTIVRLRSFSNITPESHKNWQFLNRFCFFMSYT